MIKEKLLAAYTFVRIWRTIAYSLLILGCLAAFAWSVHTLMCGISAFYSEWDAKNFARHEHNQLEDANEQKMDEAKDQYEAYAKGLPERLEAIKQSHNRELKEYTEKYRHDVALYSKNVQRVASDYNELAYIAESELKKHRNYNEGEINTLALPTEEIRTEEDYRNFCKMAKERETQISRYKERMQEILLREFTDYETPVLNKKRELENECYSLNNRISQIEADYNRRIAELENQKRNIPHASYEARPEKNIYGTTNIEELSEVLNSSDALPLIAARLSAASPLSEDNRRTLRKSLLNMSDWLPTYTKTYAPTQADIDAIHEHNRNVQNQIYTLKSKLNNELNELRRQLSSTQSQLNDFTNRCDYLAEQKKQLKAMSLAATEKWEVVGALNRVFEQINTPFPSEFEKSLEARLQQEKNKVPQQEKETQALIQSLQQEIAASKERLDATLDQLSQKERTACTAAIRQPAPIGAICESIATVLGNAPAFISEKLTAMIPTFGSSATPTASRGVAETFKSEALNLLNDPSSLGEEMKSAVTDQINGAISSTIADVLPINKWMNQGVNSIIRAISPFGAMGAVGAEIIRSIPFGAIILAFLIVSSWLVFGVLLILGDYMICPLVNATKLQEISNNTAKEEKN